MKKVILITGTSTGLGLSLAVKLAKEGHHVYATMRHLEKKEELLEACKKAEVLVKIKMLDVQKTESIDQCVKEIIETEGRIDCLVNNAGAGFVRSTEQATEEEIQWVMDVNFLGVVRCVKAVLPHMRQAKSGHILNVSSVGGLVGQPFNEIYCAAKFAVEGYTESMATYIQPSFNIKFTLIEPGGISSNFAQNVMSNIERNGGMYDDDYLPILQKYIGRHQHGRSPEELSLMYQTPEQVASVMIDCINNPSPPVRVRSSEWANQFCDLKTKSDPDGLLLKDKVFHEML